jgi:hypothetical protein
MTLLMGAPILLAGLLAVSIPILIHLLHRQKTIPLKWGAMMFLKESMLQMKRRKQVDHWLLLLLRMAVLAFLAWMLARPLFTSKIFQGGAAPAVDVAVVIDHSMSMGRRNGDHTLFEEARGVVDKLTDPTNPILRSGDTVSVVLAEHRPRKFTALPLQVDNANAMAQLHTELSELKPGTTDCTIPESIDAAREVLGHGTNLNKVVVVVSDEQKTNWNIGDFAAWSRAVGEDSAGGLERHVVIHSLPLAPDEAASNVSVEGITVSPSTVGINRPVQITAKVSNSGPKDVSSLNLHFSVNGKEEGSPQNIPTLAAGQSVTVRFDHTFTQAGSTYVKIGTDIVDALAADNEAVAAIHVWQKLPVLIVDGQFASSGGDYKSSMFLSIAMQPVDPDQVKTALIQPTIVGVGDTSNINLDDYYVVVLNDVPQLPALLQAKLAEYVTAGHGLWVILGPRSSSNYLASLGAKAQDADHVLFTADMKQPTPHEEKGAPASVEIKDPNDPMMQMVASAQRNALSGAVAQKWWSITPKDDSRIVLASTTGDPLIVGRPMGSGQVVVWATSVDGNWNNWHMMPNFVPLVNETIYQLSAAQTRQHNSGNLDAGMAISWAGPPTPVVQSVDVTKPDGIADPGHKANYRGGHYEFTYTNTFMPGLYQLRFAPTEIAQPIYYGVGIDHKELSAARLGTDDIDWLKKHKFVPEENPQIRADNLSYIVTGVEGPSGFWGKVLAFLLDWKTLAGFVMLSLFFETVMTYRMAGLQSKIDVAGSGLVKA